MKKLSNISIIQMRKILMYLGLSKLRTRGGHEAWHKNGLIRPIILQTHISPVPITVVKSIISTLNISTTDFINLIEQL